MSLRPLPSLELDLRALKLEIRTTAERLRRATRALRAQPAPPALRLLRGGLWRRRTR